MRSRTTASTTRSTCSAARSSTSAPSHDAGGNRVSQPDWTELMKKAQEVQTRMQEVQADLARRTIEGSAGGGMVTAVATGELRIREIRIEPALFEGDDRQMLQDLVAAAVNTALANAQKMVQEELQRVASQNPIAFGQQS
ncbi:MAG: YbaB/EbfC family nucleoid-associated protein [Myxococcales bacterium]|nr:YbaB/EbfC family nucleoid-associated protein [Myxococcales bacterium]